MTDYIAIEPLILLAGVAATYFAQYEADLIRAATRTGKPINHGELLTWRVIIMGAAWAVVCFGAEAWRASIPMAFAAWAWFTITHRFCLNKMRKAFPWWYVSASNVYDRFWLGLTGGRVKPAGIAAYCFELTVLAASVWAYIWIVNT